MPLFSKKKEKHVEKPSEVLSASSSDYEDNTGSKYDYDETQADELTASEVDYNFQEQYSGAFLFFKESFQTDMVEIMMATKKIERQLISNTQKNNILEACKQMAESYKAIKAELERGICGEVPLPSEILPLIEHLANRASNLTTTVQATSISQFEFQNYLPCMQTLREDIYGLKSFISAPEEDRMQQFKLIKKTQQFKFRKSKSPSAEPVSLSPSDKKFESALNPKKVVQAGTISETRKNYRRSQMLSDGILPNNKVSITKTKSESNPVSRQPSRSSSDVGKTESALTLMCSNLFEAAEQNNVKDARELRKRLGINGIDTNGWTALHHAANKGNMEVALFLIEEGINLDTTDRQGLTALDRACLNGHEEMAIFLVQRGAKFDMFSKTGSSVMTRSPLTKGFWEKLLGVPSIVHDVASTLRIKVPELPLNQIKNHGESDSRSSTPTPVSNGNAGKPETPPRSASTDEPLASPTTGLSPTAEMKNFEVGPELDQFAEIFIPCVKCLSGFSLSILSQPSIGERELQQLEKFNSPLKTFTQLLKNIFTLMKGDKSTNAFRAFHEGVVRLISAVNEASTAGLRPILTRSVHLAEIFQKFYSTCCVESANHEDIVNRIHLYLLCLKKFLTSNKENSDTAALNKLSQDVTSSMLQVFYALMRSSKKINFSISLCCQIQENTKRIIQIQNLKGDSSEIIKETMSKIREILNSLKNPGMVSAFDVFTINFDDSLQEAAKQIDDSLQYLGSLPEYLKQIKVPLVSLSKELIAMDGTDSAVEILRSCQIVSQCANKVFTYLKLFGEQCTFTSENARSMLTLLIQMLQHNSMQIKLSAITECLSHLENSGNVLNLRTLRSNLRMVGLLSGAIFEVISLVRFDIKSPREVKVKENQALRIPSLLSTEYAVQNTFQPPVPMESPGELAPDFAIKERLREDALTSGIQLRSLASVKLYKFDTMDSDQTWKETDISGILALVFHKNRGFFQITHPETLQPSFLWVIPRDMKYSQSSYYFHRFKSDSHSYVGFSFLSHEEGREFYDAVMAFLEERKS